MKKKILNYVRQCHTTIAIMREYLMAYELREGPLNL